tara:strand:+ start:776 stop:1156 length:381 start_codon:yes stop_codon:yes gene_type:complete
VQNKLLGYARNTNGRPSLATVFHAGVRVNVIHEDLHILGLDFSNLLGICENAYGVHGADEHAAGESLRQVLLDALFNLFSRLIWHPQRLEGLQEYRRTFLAYVTHHVHGSFEASDAGFDVKVGFLA